MMQVAVTSQSEIATLPNPAIEELANEELAKLIRIASLPFLTATDLARLPVLGREALLRLGFLAREFCRNQSRTSRWSALSE